MIEVRELRPGNLVLRWGQPTKICGTQVLDHTAIVLFWDGIRVDQFGCQEIHPIPLTHEWLLRCGFEMDTVEDNCYYAAKWGAIMVQVNQCKELQFMLEGVDLPHIKYLHQLQNLYFALTSEELEIKP